MKKKTTFYILRHGESLGNRDKRFLGHTNLDMTERGYQQAEKTAEVLAHIHIDVIYSSDLIRAFNTAKPHALRRNMDVIPVKELREAYAGEWENLLKTEIMDRYGNMYVDGFVGGFGTFVLPGGESIPELAERMYNAIEKIAKDEEGRVVLIASHAAAIRAFWGKISNIPPENLANELPFPSNASYSIFEYEEGVFKPIEYSVDKHMGDLFTTWSR